MSQLMKDVIKREKKITKQMQKEMKARERAKLEAWKNRPKQKSIVDEFAKNQEKFKPQLTPAEKGALTKEKNRAKKEYHERLAREKAAMEKWTAEMKIKRAKIQEAYHGSSESSVH